MLDPDLTARPTDPWDPEGQLPWPGEERQVGAGRIFVRQAPPRTPGLPGAVLVHGLGGQSTDWTDLMALLSGRVHAVAPDLPGFGHSGPPADDDYSFEAHARVVVAAIEQTAPSGEPVHLFGNSLGGALAVRVAATRPELVRSLVLVSPALPDLRPRRHTAAVPVLAAPRLGEEAWKRLAQLPPERRVQGMIDLCFGDPSRVPAVRRHRAADEYRRRASLPYAGDALSRTTRGLLAAYLAPGRDGLWRQAARVAAPTLLLYGARDKLVDPRRSTRAARTMPNARLIVLPRLGHVAQMEDPRLVAHFVERFWQEHG